MVQNGLIGIGAGAAAALLFVSPASGTPLALLLLLLAPLPILHRRHRLEPLGRPARRRAPPSLGLTFVFGVSEFPSVSIPFVLGIGAPGVVARLSCVAGAAEPASRRGRMVSGRIAGVLVRDPGRARDAGRHPVLWDGPARPSRRRCAAGSGDRAAAADDASSGRSAPALRRRDRSGIASSIFWLPSCRRPPRP